MRRRKNLKMAFYKINAAKKHQNEVFIDENRNPKKMSKEANNILNLFEEKFTDVINTGVDIFHNRISLTAISFKERLAYLLILKKITESIEWKSKRIISSRQQLECLTRKTIETSYERKSILENIEKFVDYKLKSFPGKSRKLRAESLSRHYKNELNCLGVTPSSLAKQIEDLRKAINIAEGIHEKPEKIKSTQEAKVLQHVCRLCGSKDTLIYNINQKRDNIRFKDIVEQFCRVIIHNAPHLPQLVCKNCKDYIDGICKFSEKISNFQKHLSLEDESNLILVENINAIIKTDYCENNEFSNDYYNETITDATDESIQLVNKSYDENKSMVIEPFKISDVTHISLENQNDASQTDLLVEVSNVNSNLIVSDCIQYDKDNSRSHYDEISSDKAITSTSNTHSCTNSDPLPKCYIVLEKLPIKFVPSDDEDIEQSLLNEINVKKKSSIKKPRGQQSKNLEAEFRRFFTSISDLLPVAS